MYFSLLYERGFISQYTVNTKESTYGAFSKAASSNQFGLNHEQDPKKDEVDFLLFLDNDIIILKQGWDLILKNAWDDVKKQNMNNIKIIGQLPGGITARNNTGKIAGFDSASGINGGSGFWSVRPNFFADVGYLDLKELVGFEKKHDQKYWEKLSKLNRGKDYILGLDTKLVIHTGGIAGSVCNNLTKYRISAVVNKNEVVKFEKQEEEIDSLAFDQFYDKIKDDKRLINNW